MRPKSDAGSRHAFNQRLAELSALKDGWNGTGSRGIPGHAVALASGFASLVGSDITKVHAVPSPSGDLVLEWSSGPTEVTAEIIDSHQMRLTVDCEDPDVYVERVVPSRPSTLAALFVGTK